MYCDADQDPGLDLGPLVHEEVKVDWLVLGFCFDPALYDRVRTMFKTSEVHLGRLWLARGVIYFDGRRVGSVKGSQAPTTRYGRKLLLICEGQFFRAGLTPSDAHELLRRAEVTFAEAGLLGDDLVDTHWISFVSIDRLDYALECRAGSVTRDQIEARGLAHGWQWSNQVSSRKGETAAAGTTEDPYESRTTHPMIRAYSKATPEDPAVGKTWRFEVQIPRVRTTSGQGSLVGAALLARDQLEAASGHKIEVIHPGEASKGSGLPLHVLDFEDKWLPDHVFNQPYAGHPTATLRRLVRQGTTLIERACASAVLAALIPQESGFAGAPAQTLDGCDLPEAARVRAGELEPEGRPVSLALQAPLTLEELDHLEQTLLEYRRTYYPSTQAVGVREAMPRTRHYLRAEVLDELVGRVADDVAQERYPSDDGGRGDFMQNVTRANVRSELRDDVAAMLDSYRADLDKDAKALNVADDERAAELDEAQREAEEAARWARSARAWRASCEAKLKRVQLRAHRLLNVSGPARKLYHERAQDELAQAQAAVAEAAGEVIRVEELEHLANEALAAAQARCWDRFAQLDQGRAWINKLRVPPLIRIRSRIDRDVDAPWAYRRDQWVEDYVAHREGRRRTLPAWAKEVF